MLSILSIQSRTGDSLGKELLAPNAVPEYSWGSTATGKSVESAAILRAMNQSDESLSHPNFLQCPSLVNTNPPRIPTPIPSMLTISSILSPEMRPSCLQPVHLQSPPNDSASNTGPGVSIKDGPPSIFSNIITELL